VAFQVAQVNIALPKGPMDSEVMAEFAAMLDPINALADSSPGFVWRLQDEEGDATAIRPFDDERLMINMSVWESVEALWDFVYDSRHLDVMRRRRQWFEHMKMFMCLWWVPAGHTPGVEEAKERLEHLRRHGPTERAFTFKQRFAAPGEPAGAAQPEPLAGCPAD
jgi:Domain of unknown function (DUF3291)